MSKFIVSHEDQQLGPFDETELRAKWTRGEILGVDYVYDEAKEDWIMVAERFRWAAAGALTDTIRVSPAPTAPTETLRTHAINDTLTQEITLEETAPPPPAPVRTAKVSPSVETTAHSAAPASTPASTPVRVSTAPPVVIEMNEGYGEISIDQLDAGSHELRVRNDDMPTTKFQLDVHPTEPVAVLLNAVTSAEVGTPVVIEVRVTDQRGLTCRQFAEPLIVTVDGKRHSLKPTHGVGQLEISTEKAGEVTIEASCPTQPHLGTPPMSLLEWLAGPAVRLEVDGPTEHREGSPLKVRVKAVDRFGNVARTYRGQVNLEIKAS